METVHLYRVYCWVETLTLRSPALSSPCSSLSSPRLIRYQNLRGSMRCGGRKISSGRIRAKRDYSNLYLIKSFLVSRVHLSYILKYLLIFTFLLFISGKRSLPKIRVTEETRNTTTLSQCYAVLLAGWLAGWLLPWLGVFKYLYQCYATGWDI